MLSKCKVVLSAFVLSLAITSANAADADFYVAPNGKDTNAGTLEKPFATLQRARDAVRRLKAKGPLSKPVRVLVRGGVYTIDKTIEFGPEDSGTKASPITYAAYPGEKPVISGGMPISGWKKGNGPLWTTVVPAVKEGKLYFRDLFVNGKRCTPARTPNGDRYTNEVFQHAGPLKPLKDRRAARKDDSTKRGFFFKNDNVKKWGNIDDVIVVVYHAWTSSRHHIESIDTEKKTIHFPNPSCWPMGYWGKERYYVEYVREALDVPGEWYLDRKTGLLTYYPRSGEDMTKATVVAPTIEVLVRLKGDANANKFVEHLRFEGLSFQHTKWVMPKTKTVDGQAAAFLNNATVFATAMKDCIFGNRSRAGDWLVFRPLLAEKGACPLPDRGDRNNHRPLLPFVIRDIFRMQVLYVHHISYPYVSSHCYAAIALTSPYIQRRVFPSPCVAWHVQGLFCAGIPLLMVRRTVRRSPHLHVLGRSQQCRISLQILTYMLPNAPLNFRLG